MWNNWWLGTQSLTASFLGIPIPSFIQSALYLCFQNLSKEIHLDWISVIKACLWDFSESNFLSSHSSPLPTRSMLLVTFDKSSRTQQASTKIESNFFAFRIPHHIQRTSTSSPLLWRPFVWPTVSLRIGRWSESEYELDRLWAPRKEIEKDYTRAAICQGSI